MGGARLKIVVVIPYGNANAAQHLKYDGDYKTFCGRICEGWSPSDMPTTEVIDSVYCCAKCRKAYFK